MDANGVTTNFTYDPRLRLLSSAVSTAADPLTTSYGYDAAGARAKALLQKWMSSAMLSRLEPFKKFVRLLRSHLDGILPWTSLRLSNGAVEGMNNKIKSISHRSFGFRSAKNFIAAIYHCCARLPLPIER